MLRNAFVLAILAIGALYSLQGPYYALLLYLWIAYFRPAEWVWSDFFHRLDISWYVGVYLVLAVAVWRERIRFDGRTALLLLFLGQSLVSVLSSPHSDYAWLYFKDFAKTIVIALLIASLVTDAARFRLALVVISLSLGFEAAKQGLLQLLLAPGEKNYNAIPLLGDENGVAVGMLMLVPILGVLAKTSQRPAEKWLYRLVAVGVLYRGLITYSRGGFLTCGALVGMHLWRSPHRTRTLLAICVAALIVVPVLPDAFWVRMGTIKFSTEQEDGSAAGRVHFWRVAVLMANAQPLTGVGHNAYNLSYDTYDFSGGEHGKRRSVHSSWLGVLSELGYPGLLLFVASLFAAFRACSRVRRAAGTDPDTHDLWSYAAALESGLVAFLVGGSFVIFQYTEMLWHTIGLAFALEAIAGRTDPRRGESALAGSSASAPAGP